MKAKSAWKCDICSDTCRKLGITGTWIYNLELENPTGNYEKSIITPTEGAPDRNTVDLLYRCSKPTQTFTNVCKTCYDMCEAVSSPDREALQERALIVSEYFVNARTKEYLELQEKLKGGGGGIAEA